MKLFGLKLPNKWCSFFVAAGIVWAFGSGYPVALAQNLPLRIEITQGVIEPMPIAVSAFVAENGAAKEYATNISRVIADDLSGTGLFREIPASAHISKISGFTDPVAYADWKAVNAQALIIGSVFVQGGNVTVKFRLLDVFSGQQMGEGLQFTGPIGIWRRMAHKVADASYSRLTGEEGYFDSRVVFVAETGAKNKRAKRLAIMDYDGVNVEYLTDDKSIVLAPRLSLSGDKVLFTSYKTDFPKIYMMDLVRKSVIPLAEQKGTMTFSPRFAPDGKTVIYSLEQGGNTDIYALNIASGASRQLTNAPSIETAPSFSPGGQQIVFESDRSGGQQIYIMDADGQNVRRISSGQGRYGTPVWSPRGDLIAFTKQNQGRFHIGVMRTDGTEERLLTASFLDEAPTWAPNGRVIMFTRETSGASGQSSLYSVDISGRNLKRVKTDGA
ncbi:MAG: Tol-Pal system beta propeller repeat protein TolB, partial [Paracoccaceae bacterium]